MGCLMNVTLGRSIPSDLFFLRPEPPPFHPVPPPATTPTFLIHLTTLGGFLPPHFDSRQVLPQKTFLVMGFKDMFFSLRNILPFFFGPPELTGFQGSLSFSGSVPCTLFFTGRDTTCPSPPLTVCVPVPFVSKRSFICGLRFSSPPFPHVRSKGLSKSSFPSLAGNCPEAPPFPPPPSPDVGEVY